ncbi:Pyridoxamine 5'-phosphate oxidase [Corynebacterium heidelbergense]|nr:Pyridoxamine 5'-phosphate oxidase [Corynebacterium heidelbergense]
MSKLGAMSQDAQTSDQADQIDELNKIIEDVGVAMVTTHDSEHEGRLISRPFSTQRAEDSGDVVFLTTKDNSFTRDVRQNPHVNIAYASKKAWVSFAGTAEIVEDNALVEQLWSRASGMFMEGGPENPNNVAVRVHGDTAELWGGGSLVGTAIKTVKAMTGDTQEEKEDDGTKVIDLK